MLPKDEGQERRLELTGSRLSHFQILQKIGQGGMGEVYLADDLSLGRKVALKFLPETLQQDPAAHSRFLHEARSAAALDHPYICHVNEVGAYQGKDFIAMEYLVGETLRERLRKGPVPLKKALQAASEIAEALETAHAKGIVHRDLKPANIMLTATGHVKVMDFGLAKRVEPPAGAADEKRATVLTGEGMVLGTPDYMSPEQLCGRPADARSDIFSFGILLFEMVAGRHPFMKGTGVETATAILSASPPSIRDALPDASASLDRVLNKMLAKDPGQRYQSMAEARVDLAQILQERQPGAGPIPPGMRRPVWILLALLLVSLVGSFSWWIQQRYFRSPAEALAFRERDWVLITDFENQTGEPMFDQSLNTAIAVSMEQSRYANVLSRSRIAATLKRMRKPTNQKIDETIGSEICQREKIRGLIVPGIAKVGQQYSLTARIVDPYAGNTVRSYMEAAPDQSHILPTLDKLATTIRGDLGESLSSVQQSNLELSKVTTSSLEALRLYSEGRALQAKADYRAAVQRYEDALKLDPDFAKAHAALGMAYCSFLFHERVLGKQHLDKALSLSDRLTERERSQIQIQYEDAVGDGEKALALYPIYLKEYPDDTRWRYNYGTSLMQRGQTDEAIAQFKEVLRVDPNYASAHINLATSYADVKNWAESIKSYSRAFELEPGWMIGDNLNHEYGFVLLRAGRATQARETFTKGLEGARPLALRSLGLLDMYEGKYRSAQKQFAEAALLNAAGKKAFNEARDHLFLAIAFEGLGDEGQRRLELDKAIKDLQTIGPQVILTARVAVNCVRAEAPASARRLLEKIRKEVETNQPNQSSELHRLEGELQLVDGNSARAVESLLLADRESQSPLSIESLAHAYSVIGDAPSAIAQYELLLTRDTSVGYEPQHAWFAAHYDLARLYQKQRQTQKAKELVDRVLQLWKGADADLPLLKKVRQLRTELGS